MLHLHVVPDTSTKLVAPAAEVVIHAPPAEVHPTGSTGLWPGFILGPCSRVAPSSVSHLRNQPLLLANVFGSPDHDEGLDGDDMAPLEHHLASGSLSSPHPWHDSSHFEQELGWLHFATVGTSSI